jgi:hypothetical protein
MMLKGLKSDKKGLKSYNKGLKSETVVERPELCTGFDAVMTAEVELRA